MKRIAAVAYDGFQLLDLAGPADVFDVANQVLGRQAYGVEIVGVHSGRVRAGNGVALYAVTPDELPPGRIDTVVVAGGTALLEDPVDQAVVDAIVALATRADRVASVCTGAFVLAAAGLLTRRRATTHWLATDRLARAHPDIEVEPDAIYIRDGNIWTSAGVTAGIDLALALVAADYGHDVARVVASGLVVYLQRPGGQSQFSTALRARPPASEALRELQVYIDANPAADLGVAALAERIGMSPRHFTRVFTAQLGIAPGRYVERSRADAARRLLETTDATHEWIARASGIGSPESLYRVFRRRWSVSPGTYRRMFHTPAHNPPHESH
ncbi:GlxA family transcriptional regulator [Nocardia sp. NPDC004568]|uniref:GlxA family transcriptional regulator n=1 Tax=Nocardia sp. NPDC004568 TaxID=3154551 RepID=UPI0033AB276C